MLIEVTAEDIRLGKRDHCYRCPIARAIARELKVPLSRKYVEVTDKEVFLSDSKFISTRANLSKRACKFIKDFDSKKSPKTFKFKLKFSEAVTDLLR